MDKTRVSIIMPTYNRRYIIETAIQSVMQQSMKEWELLIVDDGSTERMDDVVKKINDPRIKYFFYSPNRGANYARNLGMENANGEYLAFLDSDNIWNVDFLQNRLEMINSYQVEMVFGRMLRIEGNEELIWPVETEEQLNDREYVIRKMFKENVVDTNTGFFHRICYEELGGFDENLDRGQDWEYFFRLLSSRKYRYRFADNVLVTNVIQLNSVSNTKSYWNSRMYFFRKYEDMCRREGYFYETVLHILHTAGNCGVPIETRVQFVETFSEDEVVEVWKRYIEFQNNRFNQLCVIFQKNESIMKFQDKWLRMEIEGKSIVTILKSRGLYRIGIYGFGMLGRTLYKEVLKDKEMQIRFIIDQKTNKEIDDRSIHFLSAGNLQHEKKIPSVDIVIIAVLSDFADIKKLLEQYFSCRIESMEEVWDLRSKGFY